MGYVQPGTSPRRTPGPHDGKGPVSPRQDSGFRRNEAKKSKRGLRPVLRWIHATLGLFAGLYLLMAAATGALLLFKHELLGLAHPELGPVPADIVARAERLAETLPPGSFSSIKFPDEALPAFMLYRTGGGTALYDPATLAPLEDRFGLNAAMDWLFDLHHYLLAGDTGKLISGAFGLAIAGLILIGLYLWWPWRRGWRLSHAWPKRATRASRLAGHTTLAVPMAPILFVSALTGSAVVFHEPARALFVGLLGEKEPSIPVPATSAPLPRLTRELLPHAAPRLLIVPKQPDGTLTLRLRQPEESHPNGRSTLTYESATGRVIAATSEPESGAGSRAYNLLYPIHIGSIGGTPLRLVYLASAILAFLAGFYALRSRLTRRRR